MKISRKNILPLLEQDAQSYYIQAAAQAEHRQGGTHKGQGGDLSFVSKRRRSSEQEYGTTNLEALKRNGMT